MILQSTKVIQACEEYAKLVPEVPLMYSEDDRGMIVHVPSNFNNIPPMLRATAFAEIEKLLIHLTLIQTNPRIEKGIHVV